MKKLIACLALLYMSVSVKAQLLGSINLDPKVFPASSSCDLLVNKAISGSVVVVRQSYQVKNKKNGKVYGRHGGKEFGQHFSIGVKTENGLVITNAAMTPWAEDDAYKKIEKDYDAFISFTEIREIVQEGESTYSQCPLAVDSNQPQGLWLAQTKNFKNNLLELDLENGKKDGWIMWYTMKKAPNVEPNSPVNIQSITKKIELADSVTIVDVEAPSDGDIVLGGIYVCPTYYGGGHVIYKLVGMTILDNGKWHLNAPFASFSPVKNSQDENVKDKAPEEQDIINEEKQEEEEDVELTPIDQDKKKKKSKK